MTSIMMRSRLGLSSNDSLSTNNAFASTLTTCNALQDEYYKCRYRTVAHPLLRDRCNYQRAVALKCERGVTRLVAAQNDVNKDFRREEDMESSSSVVGMSMDPNRSPLVKTINVDVHT